ncbi:hypothetical protein B0H19DRAFT_1269210 [Mycena capillaripes]|nr:hypothetical protein B0H19DRAFT_1269210 [Mycena capillaripes]
MLPRSCFSLWVALCSQSPSVARSLSLGLETVVFFVTTSVSGYPSFSTVLECDIVATAEFDVILGLDWAALVRDFLMRLGYRLDSSFDVWLFFSTPSHPIGNITSSPPCHSGALSGSFPAQGNVASPPPVRSGAVHGSSAALDGAVRRNEHNNSEHYSEIYSETTQFDIVHDPSPITSRDSSTRNNMLKFVGYVPRGFNPLCTFG